MRRRRADIKFFILPQPKARQTVVQFDRTLPFSANTYGVVYDRHRSHMMTTGLPPFVLALVRRLSRSRWIYQLEIHDDLLTIRPYVWGFVASWHIRRAARVVGQTARRVETPDGLIHNVADQLR